MKATLLRILILIGKYASVHHCERAILTGMSHRGVVLWGGRSSAPRMQHTQERVLYRLSQYRLDAKHSPINSKCRDYWLPCGAPDGFARAKSNCALPLTNNPPVYKPHTSLI